MEKKPMLSRITQQYLDTYERILQNMIRQMREFTRTDSISHNFIVRMIPHHQGAAAMARTALQYPICPELKPVLQSIIATQQQGIIQMQQLQRRMRCPAR